MEALFFASQYEFRKWLEHNHKKESELIVGFYKVNTGKPSLTWSQSVDQALCFGWIDGIRKSIDSESYCIRFTPRRPDSVWSEINIKKVEELTRLGLMFPAGIEAFGKRKKNKTGIYSFENANLQLTEEFESMFKQNITAWTFFSKQAPSYKKVKIFWIMSAKQYSTQLSRLKKTINESEKKKTFI